MLNLRLNVLEFLGLAWWVEVKTDECTYYFGPFADKDDAAAAQAGYVEDLEGEGASNIQVMLTQSKPSQLTVETRVDESAKKGNPALA